MTTHSSKLPKRGTNISKRNKAPQLPHPGSKFSNCLPNLHCRPLMPVHRIAHGNRHRPNLIQQRIIVLDRSLPVLAPPLRRALQDRQSPSKSLEVAVDFNEPQDTRQCTCSHRRWSRTRARRRPARRRRHRRTLCSGRQCRPRLRRLRRRRARRSLGRCLIRVRKRSSVENAWIRCSFGTYRSTRGCSGGSAWP